MATDEGQTISPAEAAQLLHLNPRTLAQWRWEGGLPGNHHRIPFFRIGRRICYYLKDVLTFKAMGYQCPPSADSAPPRRPITCPVCDEPVASWFRATRGTALTCRVGHEWGVESDPDLDPALEARREIPSASPTPPRGQLILMKPDAVAEGAEPEVIKICEDLLARARRGELVSVAVAGVAPDGGAVTAYATGAREVTLLAAVALLQHRYAQVVWDR